MSDTNDQSPPAPTTSDETPPPSSDNSPPSPPPSDQSSGSSPPPSDNTGNPSSPPSPPPADDTSSSPPPSPSSPPPGSPPPSPPSPPPSSSPPPVSNSPPPTVPILSPPPQQSPPLSPPPAKPSSPPPTRSNKSPPPHSPPQKESQSPPPPSSDPQPPPSPDSTTSPPPPDFKPPPNSPISPPSIPTPNSPPANTPPESYAPPTSYSPPPSSNPTTPSKAISPPGSNSRSNSSTPSSSSSSDNSDSAAQYGVQSGAVVGVAVAGVFLVAVIAMFFVCSSRRRRRKRTEVYAAPPRYIPAGNMSVKSDGYYPGGQQQQQHHNINFNSGPADYYPPPTPNSHGMSSGGGGGGVTNSGGGIGGPNPYFSYEELAEITNGFSSQNVLGEGGFGCVYKGWLPDGKVVAVKQLKAGSGQGEREFKAEVEIISRVHHRHLVSLVGYCISEHHRLLVYEFVPNNTLEHHLHGAGLPVLDWSERLKIALGAAKGLAYLHEDCHPKIIHRDIKSANILLEDSFEAQVADFGLAKPSNDMNTHVSTRVMGTFGYMAPEYASSGKLTDRSDVFSFGVVLLELITGRKSVDPTRPLGDESLVEWARPLLIRALESGDLSELVDPRLENRYVESEMTRMVEAAAACVRHSAPKRPRMVQVARALDCGGEMSDLSNGVKYGQSTIYESGQYNQDIMKFRKMALEDSSDYDEYSGEFGKPKEAYQDKWKPADGSSGESETRAFNSSNFGEQRFGNRYF